MKIELKVQNRNKIGTNQAKKLRADNKIPGVIYTKGKDARHISVDPADFYKVYREAGSSKVIYLNLDDENIPVLIREVQTNPVKELDFLHVDFLKLDLEEKIKVNIPIVLLNRDNIRLQPSILMQLTDEIEVECLPTDIPQSAEIDVRDMDFDTPKYVRDADVAKMDNVEVLTELDKVVCTLSAPAAEAEEEDVDEEASVETPVDEEEKTE
ncbi:MAG: 50S ribosomal protein L25 [Caldicoprobacterales bacterium]|jgi:large subunit ribosomal protein L25|nr:50S ribosomal protein L25 [Clostridiales bacterium]